MSSKTQGHAASAGREAAPRRAGALPHIFDVLDDHLSRLGQRRLAAFLDYDGTLAPIARHPSEALLPQATKEALIRLRDAVPVSIVTGRDIDDVRKLIGIEGLDYIGNHGLERVVAGERVDHPDAAAHRGTLGAVADELEEAAQRIDGAWVERKRYAVVLHDREVDDARLDEIRIVVQKVRHAHPDLPVTAGRRVHEFRPPVDADKGLAVLDAVRQLGGTEAVYPVYVGDDTTDEDAFREIRDIGLGVLVRHDDRPTWARAALDAPLEMAELIDGLLARARD